jgi:hypothetical protein
VTTAPETTLLQVQLTEAFRQGERGRALHAGALSRRGVSVR